MNGSFEDPTEAGPLSWTEFWAGGWCQVEWLLAARAVCELSTSVQALASSYVEWVYFPADPDGPECWVSRLDWRRLGADLDVEGRTGLTPGRVALARVAVGLVHGSGGFDYQMLSTAGYLSDVTRIVGTCAVNLAATATSVDVQDLPCPAQPDSRLHFLVQRDAGTVNGEPSYLYGCQYCLKSTSTLLVEARRDGLIL